MLVLVPLGFLRMPFFGWGFDWGFGFAEAGGGDAMAKVEVIVAVGGFQLLIRFWDFVSKSLRIVLGNPGRSTVDAGTGSSQLISMMFSWC